MDRHRHQPRRWTIAAAVLAAAVLLGGPWAVPAAAAPPPPPACPTGSQLEVFDYHGAPQLATPKPGQKPVPTWEDGQGKALDYSFNDQTVAWRAHAEHQVVQEAVFYKEGGWGLVTGHYEPRPDLLLPFPHAYLAKVKGPYSRAAFCVALRPFKHPWWGSGWGILSAIVAGLALIGFVGACLRRS